MASGTSSDERGGGGGGGGGRPNPPTPPPPQPTGLYLTSTTIRGVHSRGGESYMYEYALGGVIYTLGVNDRGQYCP